jgi:hypothetical protein
VAAVTADEQARALGKLVITAQQWGAGTERATICRWLRSPEALEHHAVRMLGADAHEVLDALAYAIERDAHGSEEGLRRATTEYDTTQQQEPEP